MPQTARAGRVLCGLNEEKPNPSPRDPTRSAGPAANGSGSDHMISWFSPEGATVSSQGRKPLENDRYVCALQPRRGDSPGLARTVAPSGLQNRFILAHFVPRACAWATDGRPVGTATSPPREKA